LPVKIHQLAKDMQVASKDIITICQQNKIEVKGAQSTIPDDAVAIVRQTLEMMLSLGSIQKEIHKPAKKKPPAPKKKKEAPVAGEAGGTETAAAEAVGPLTAEEAAEAAQAEAEAEALEEAKEAAVEAAKTGVETRESTLELLETAEQRRRKKKKKKKKDKGTEGTEKEKPAIEIRFQHVGEAAGEEKVPEGLFSVVGQVDLPPEPEKPAKAPSPIAVEDEEDEKDEKAARIRALLNRLGRNWEDLPGIQKVRSLTTGPGARGQQQQQVQHRRRRPKRRKLIRNLNESPYRGKTVTIYPPLTPRMLAEALGVQLNIIQAHLVEMEKEVDQNESLADNEAQMIASDFEVTLDIRRKEPARDKVKRMLEEIDAPEAMKPRPPVITIMGHVDHGKTTLLDKIRSTNIAAGEFGGITQHIGAYFVEWRGHTITFLDTPGHEAFTEMRSRGAKLTDIVVLVVSGSDGVMPQTEEAIQHARQAKVPIIVAVNKMDLPGANFDRVKQQLTSKNVISEDWGGDVLMTPVSALKGEGIDKLLESILLQAEIMELKAAPNRPAQGYVIEARQTEAQGPLVDVLVTRGTLKPGAVLVAGKVAGRVRILTDWLGRPMKETTPGMPARVLGFSEVPEAGATVLEVGSVEEAREIGVELGGDETKPGAEARVPVTLEMLTAHLEASSKPELKVIVKTDVRGSAEAIQREIEKTAALTKEAKVDILHTGVGAVNVSDVLLASTGGAVIFAFNVGIEGMARKEAEAKAVQIRTYRIIYDLADDVRKALEGLLAPDEKEVVVGHAEVRQVFDVSHVGRIAGCMVTDGKVERRGRARVLRQGRIVHQAPLADLKRFKDDAREVREGFECGIRISGYDDVRVGDVIEVYVIEKVDKKL
jgi:translation initiation factor IF-2